MGAKEIKQSIQLYLDEVIAYTDTIANNEGIPDHIEIDLAREKIRHLYEQLIKLKQVEETEEEMIVEEDLIDSNPELLAEIETQPITEMEAENIVEEEDVIETPISDIEETFEQEESQIEDVIVSEEPEVIDLTLPEEKKEEIPLFELDEENQEEAINFSTTEQEIQNEENVPISFPSC